MHGHSSSAAKMMTGFAALLCFACGQGERPRDAAPGLAPTPGTPSFSGLQPTLVDLEPWLPAQAKLVGIAVAPDGERYVLDATSGLYHFGAGGVERVLDSQTLDERYGLAPDLELTDVVAYGPDRFLVTAENDGFLLDLWAGTMQSYFCYLPPSEPGDAVGQDPSVPVSISQVLAASGVPVKQRTESVAVNPLSGEIFAQPQTLRLDAGLAPAAGVELDPVAGSELFVFQSAGGEPSEVQAVDPNFLAGGMVAKSDRLFLGFGDGLFELTPSSIPARIGYFPTGTVVTGMALDLDGALLVLDGPARRLLRFQSALP